MDNRHKTELMVIVFKGAAGRGFKVNRVMGRTMINLYGT